MSETMLERVERISANEWTLDGTPITQWVTDAIKNADERDHLAGRIATSEGLVERTEAWCDRVSEIIDEVEAWGDEMYAQLASLE